MVGVTDFHRQQRKKDLQKNKTARIAARDAKVKEEKTEQSIKDEIAKVEKQYPATKGDKNDNDERPVPHAIKSKLERLRKELKLVQQAATESASSTDHKQQSQTQQNVQQQQQSVSFQPLTNPVVSVYYDAMWNPLGAPPPGKPRLYHRIGGGVTMNIHEAGIPGQPPPPPPPPPPPVPRMHIVQDRNNQTSSRSMPSRPGQRNDNTRPHDRNNYNNRQSATNRPGSRPNDIADNKQALHKSNDNAVVPKTSNSKATDPAKKATSKPVVPEVPPQLPQPSASVKRTKRKDMLADIWASTDEIEYEKAAGLGELEGVTALTAKEERKQKQTSKKVETTPTQIWYQDTSGNVQGPYGLDQMKQWTMAGYFPSSTMVRVGPTMPWKLISQVAALTAADQKEIVTDRSTHQRESDQRGQMSVQERIAALRQTHVADNMARTIEGDEEDDQAIESSVQDRIAALKDMQSSCRSDDTTDHQRVQDEAVGENNIINVTDIAGSDASAQQVHSNSDVNDDVQSRIDALKGINNSTTASDSVTMVKQTDHDAVSKFDRVNSDGTGRVHLSATAESTVDIDHARSGQYNNSEAMTDDVVAPTDGDDSHGPAAYPVDDDNDGPDAYPVNGDNDGPTAYPVDDDNAYGEPAAYPVDDDNDGLASYPVDDDYGGPAPYPVDDDYSGPAAYPVDDGDEEAVMHYTSDELVVAPYPTGEDYGSNNYDDDTNDAPVVDVYPSQIEMVDDSHHADEVRIRNDEDTAEPAKKKVKIDKALVSFMPSHLQKARLAAKKKKATR